MRPKNVPQLLKIIILFGVYFITAKIGLAIHPVNNFATLIWLPSGVSLAALLIFGFKIWPGITMGAFLANLTTGAPPLVALGIAMGNTLEPLVGAYLLRRVNFRNSLDRLKDVLALIILAAFISTIISATIGVASLFLGGIITKSNLNPTWIAWWIGDLISILIITPLILVWGSKPRIHIKPIKVIEFGIIILFYLAVYLVVFRSLFGLRLVAQTSAYMIFSPLIWTALSFGQLGGVTAIFVLSILSILNTLQGHGPFVLDSPSQNLLSLQIFMAVTSITTLILAAVITERKQLEKSKDEFISIAAHELKTPITTIKGYTQLLQVYLNKRKDNKGSTYISKISTYVDNLTRLINDFFDVSKIQADKLELQKEVLDIDNLVKETVVDVKRANPRHKISVIGSTKRKVLADKYRIAQVLTNLLSNAIKFSPKVNKINVYLSSNKTSTKISVQDFGIGISKKHLDNIFERFFQVNTQIRQSAAGLGLGLFISFDIINRHKGRIWVESEKGKGSTFHFSLPIKTKI